jgi:AmmeMemoRadiSam system protein A
MIVHAFMVPHPPVAVPEIGRGEERKIQPTLDSFREVAREIAALRPETIVLSTPHSTMYRDYFLISPGKHARGDFARYGRPDVAFSVDYDEEFTLALADTCRRHGMAAGTDFERDPSLDQGTMVPLYYINQEYRDYRLVRVGLSGQSLPEHYKLGERIQEVAELLGRRVVYVASGDLSHCQLESGPYGWHPEGPEYDRRIMSTMGRAAFGELLEYDPVFLEKAEECGHRSFVIMAGALDGMSVTPHVLTHEATLGVGYGFVSYDVGGRDECRHFLAQYEEKVRQSAGKSTDPYVRLAREAVVSWVIDRKRIRVPEKLPTAMLTERAGAFVSLHEFGELRGCIGTIAPTAKNIAEEIIGNGISACSRDPRFDPVREEELPYLEISVDVLGKPELIHSPDELDVRKYGVICMAPDGRRGLLLPDLDGVDTVEDQIRIACRKGGIGRNEKGIRLERFEVVRHV